MKKEEIKYLMDYSALMWLGSIFVLVAFFFLLAAQNFLILSYLMYPTANIVGGLFSMLAYSYLLYRFKEETGKMIKLKEELNR